jgi:hypothetical protein
LLIYDTLFYIDLQFKNENISLFDLRSGQRGSQQQEIIESLQRELHNAKQLNLLDSLQQELGEQQGLDLPVRYQQDQQTNCSRKIFAFLEFYA